MSALSRLARDCAHLSCERSGTGSIGFEKDDAGVPLPGAGWYWSVSHKSGMVCGVVSRGPVGIDIERFKPVSKGLFSRIVRSDERDRFYDGFGPSQADKIFFRTFTAKEAVLKKEGVGIKGLPSVQVKRVTDNTHLVVGFKGKNYQIEHFYLDDHIVSVTKDLFEVSWSVEKTHNK